MSLPPSFSHLLPITHCKVVAGPAKTLVRDSKHSQQTSPLLLFAMLHIRSALFPLPFKALFVCDILGIGSEVARAGIALLEPAVQRCISASTSLLVLVNPPTRCTMTSKCGICGYVLCCSLTQFHPLS